MIIIIIIVDTSKRGTKKRRRKRLFDRNASISILIIGPITARTKIAVSFFSRRSSLPFPYRLSFSDTRYEYMRRWHIEKATSTFSMDFIADD